MNNICDCFKKVPRIPRGNDFKFLLHLVENIVVGFHQVEEREVQGTVNVTSVLLYNSNGVVEPPISEGSASNGTNTYSFNDNTIMLCFYNNANLPVGKYGIEVIFTVTNDGITLDRRFYAPPGYGFYIVESTPEGFIPSDKVMTYEIAANLGLGTLVDLSGYPTNEQLASALSGKVDKVIDKGLSANDFTDEYKDALDEIMEGGGVSIDVINSLLSTEGDKALSAAQGYILRREITKIFNALSNSAFSTAKPTLDWNMPVTYSITQNLLHCTSSHSGNTIDGSSAATITLTPESGYVLKTQSVSVTVAGGGSSTITKDSSTGKVTISIPNVTGTVTITAMATAIVNYTVTNNLTNCTSNNSDTQIVEDSTYSAILSPSSGYTLSGVTPTITMGGSAVTGAWDAETKTITIANVSGNIVITVVAVESQTPSVTYNLTEVNKTSGSTEVEEGGSLTAVLSAAENYSGLHPAGNRPVQFAANEVVVMMGGRVLQNKTSQASLGGDVTINIDNVTDDVLIMNVIWDTGIMNASTGEVNASLRSVENNSTRIPIPNGCLELAIVHHYADTGSWGIVFFDGNGDMVSGIAYASTDTVNEPETISVPTGAVSFACSLYAFSAGNINMTTMFIKDKTHDEYIWKGDNVQ